ncbi:MAG: Unknown protein [uncultured Aureispira sp.]|uniref:Uncharacterized protein n=1 Tax=uncultured Aureispira sp. TaxID=1331704 RepID=A0A6S6TX46_9BACT|nr:MAG: Unknown protein [uncultured Aureispira sp.]
MAQNSLLESPFEKDNECICGTIILKNKTAN